MAQYNPIFHIFATLKLYIHKLNNMLMNQDIMKALESCPLFDGLSQKEICGLVSIAGCKIVELKKNDRYLISGETLRHCDIAAKGELAARLTGMSGRQVEVIKIKGGDIIAPCFIFSSDSKLPVDIEATEDTTIIRMKREGLSVLIDDNKLIRRNFIRYISDIGAYLATRIEFLSLMTIREKIIYFLRTEAALQHSLSIRLNTSRQRLADSFGVQKFSLLRCLAELSSENIIRIDGKNIEIIDIKRLK